MELVQCALLLPPEVTRCLNSISGLHQQFLRAVYPGIDHYPCQSLQIFLMFPDKSRSKRSQVLEMQCKATAMWMCLVSEGWRCDHLTSCSLEKASPQCSAIGSQKLYMYISYISVELVVLFPSEAQQTPFGPSPLVNIGWLHPDYCTSETLPPRPVLQSPTAPDLLRDCRKHRVLGLEWLGNLKHQHTSSTFQEDLATPTDCLKCISAYAMASAPPRPVIQNLLCCTPCTLPTDPHQPTEESHLLRILHKFNPARATHTYKSGSAFCHQSY